MTLSPELQRLIDDGDRQHRIKTSVANDNDDEFIREWRHRLGLTREEFKAEEERYERLYVGGA